MLLRDRESGSNRGGIFAEKKKTENETLGNTRGNISRCKRVVANGDSLRATSKIGFNQIIDYPSKPKLFFSRLRRMAIMA